MRLITLLLTLTLIGCGVDKKGTVQGPGFKVNTEFNYNDQELTQYQTTFNYITGFDNNVNIRYQTSGESFSGNTVGVCFYGKNLIVLSAELRDGPEVYLKWVIYHELLHCTLGLGHSSDRKSLLYDSYTPESLQFLIDDEAAAINYSIEEAI